MCGRHPCKNSRSGRGSTNPSQKSCGRPPSSSWLAVETSTFPSQYLRVRPPSSSCRSGKLATNPSPALCGHPRCSNYRSGVSSISPSLQTCRPRCEKRLEWEPVCCEVFRRLHSAAWLPSPAGWSGETGHWNEYVIDGARPCRHATDCDERAILRETLGL